MSDQDQTTGSIIAGLSLLGFLALVAFAAWGLISILKESGWHP